MITEKNTKQEILDAYQELAQKFEIFKAEGITGEKVAELIKMMPDDEAYKLYIMHHNDVELYNRLNGGVK